jgi:hypothetical protein
MAVTVALLFTAAAGLSLEHEEVRRARWSQAFTKVDTAWPGGLTVECRAALDPQPLLEQAYRYVLEDARLPGTIGQRVVRRRTGYHIDSGQR